MTAMGLPQPPPRLPPPLTRSRALKRRKVQGQGAQAAGGKRRGQARQRQQRWGRGEADELACGGSQLREAPALGP